MDASTSPVVSAGPAALLAAAPHRPLFLAGTIAVLLSMAWWTAELVSLRFGWAAWPQPTIPPVWGHAMLIQYGLFPLFMFGFLMTTFPRWMNGPIVPSRRYLPVAGGVLGGYIVGTIGLLGMPVVLKIGVAMMLAGYLVGVSTLAGALRAAADRNKHGWSTLAAFCVGTVGLALFLAWLLFPDELPADTAWVAVRMGTFTFLLPIYFTVTHRMLPFFSRNMVPGYEMWRPNWSLPVAWALLIAHVVLESLGVAQWLWIADVPLALVFGAHWLMWKPWRCMHPGLLAVLHIAFAWLPIGFVLFSAQDIVYATSGAHILGLAPLHAIAIGFFGSMLVAMVTRVTHGHSGRPLQMHPVPWLCFGLLQVVALLRIRAELGGDHYLWLVVAGAGWLVAFLPWVLRSAWIYLTPRADGRPG